MAQPRTTAACTGCTRAGGRWERALLQCWRGRAAKRGGLLGEFTTVADAELSKRGFLQQQGLVGGTSFSLFCWVVKTPQKPLKTGLGQAGLCGSRTGLTQLGGGSRLFQPEGPGEWLFALLAALGGW